ncbi:MAG: hypothetical protein GX217_06195 [Clostridiaceae bacterium]|nr:hypothetical protein [Clostridiaceae bacterium]
MSMSVDNKLIQELGKVLPDDGLDYDLEEELFKDFQEVAFLAMVEEDSEWRFSQTLTELLSDYIYKIENAY